MIRSIALFILAVLIASVVSVLALAATKPDTFRVARSITIDAPPEQVFPLINDLRSNTRWSPFEKDPDMKRSFSEITAGKGASYAWDGNSDVGKGSIEIVESTPPSNVKMNLVFEEPMQARNDVEFDLTGSGDTTKVTWSMFGPQPFIAKVVSVFMDCEKMVGDEFEKGLANLKTAAEQQATP